MLIKYGLFYIGLTDRGYYWEIVVINLRKVIFICIAVSFSKETKMMQALMCFIVLYANLSLLKYVKPYNKKYLNFMDEVASVTAILTLLNGIFFLDPVMESSENGILILFVIILAVNIAYLLYWMFYMGKVIFSKARNILKQRVRRELIEEFKEEEEKESSSRDISSHRLEKSTRRKDLSSNRNILDDRHNLDRKRKGKTSNPLKQFD